MEFYGSHWPIKESKGQWRPSLLDKMEEFVNFEAAYANRCALRPICNMCTWEIRRDGEKPT